MSTLKERIFAVINKPAPANLATISERGKPWTRYIMITGSNDLTLRIATFINSRKVQHIRSNPEVHITCGLNDLEKWDTYLQIQGIATISTDLSEKEALWKDELNAYFKGPDDPNYAVIIVKPYRIEFNSMEHPFEAEIWEA